MEKINMRYPGLKWNSKLNEVWWGQSGIPPKKPMLPSPKQTSEDVKRFEEVKAIWNNYK